MSALRVQPRSALADVSRRMEEALRQVEPRRSGAVLSWAEREEPERAPEF